MPPSARPAICCWITGVVVTAVITSAVLLPSGAMLTCDVIEQESPFLSQVFPGEDGKGLQEA